MGKEATLYTVMSVTENDVSLYGFATEEQQACFEMLTAVSGVGPKVGLAILSVMEPQRVALAISAGDHKAFKAANGVGPKLAQRIVLELKDKVAKGFVDGINLEDVGAATAAPAAQGAKQSSARPSTRPSPKGISAPYSTAQPPANPRATAPSRRTAGRNTARASSAGAPLRRAFTVKTLVRSVIQNSPLSGGALWFCSPHCVHIL